VPCALTVCVLHFKPFPKPLVSGLQSGKIQIFMRANYSERTVKNINTCKIRAAISIKIPNTSESHYLSKFAVQFLAYNHLMIQFDATLGG